MRGKKKNPDYKKMRDDDLHLLIDGCDDYCIGMTTARVVGKNGKPVGKEFISPMRKDEVIKMIEKGLSGENRKVLGVAIFLDKESEKN